MRDQTADLIASNRELARACKWQASVVMAGMRQRWTLDNLADRYSRSPSYIRDILKRNGFTDDQRRGQPIRLHIRDVLRLDRVMDAIDAGEDE